MNIDFDSLKKVAYKKAKALSIEVSKLKDSATATVNKKLNELILNVKKFRDINKVDDNGNTALHRAIIENDIEQVNSIIQSQSVIKQKLALFNKNNQGLTPIDLILEEASAEASKFSDELKQMVLHAQDFNGDTALHKAILEQDIFRTQYLIQQGANIFLQNENKISPLQLLFYQRQQGIDKNFNELLQILVNSQDLYGNSLMYYIATNPDLLATSKSQDIMSCTHLKEFGFFIRTQQTKEIAIRQKLCVDHISNVNHKNNQGATALHYAVKAQNTPLVHILLDKDADINIKDNQGYTVLHYAFQLDNINLICILLARGADPTIPNPQGYSSLDCMKMRPHHYNECLKLCHDYQNDANSKALVSLDSSAAEPIQPECCVSTVDHNQLQTENTDLNYIGDTNT